MQFYVQQVLTVIETIGYMPNNQNGITDFVPKDQAAISAAEIVDPALSYRIIEYNHHSMKGDLERKKATLIALADKLEPKRAKLKQVSGSLESDLFYLLNSVNVRHNNADQVGKNYIHFVADMKDGDIAEIIDGPILLQGDSDTIVWWFVKMDGDLQAWAAANTSATALLERQQ